MLRLLSLLSALAAPTGVEPMLAQETPATTPAVDPTRAALDAVNKDWYRRDSSGVITKTIATLEALQAQEPSNFEVKWQLARFYYWAATEPSTDAATKASLGKKGWDAAEAAKKLNPSAVEGYYWTAANIGAYAQASGIMTAIKQGLGDVLEQNAKKAVQISPKHDQAGPLRALGRYYYKLPWPLQDLENARIYLEKAYAASPTNALNILYLAELEYADDHDDKGKALLDELFALDPAKGDGPSTRRTQKEGRAFLAEQ